MGHARSGWLAYAAFLVACLVPAWRYRAEVGAEAQIRLEKPLSWRTYWNDLGPQAVDYLLRVVDSGPPLRRRRAEGALNRCENPVVSARLMIHQGSGFSDRLVIALRRMLSKGREVTREHWGAAMDALSDDEQVVALDRLARGDQGCGRPPLVDFWDSRPESCERVVARVLASTGDPRLAGVLVMYAFHPPTWPSVGRWGDVRKLDDELPEVHDARLRTLRAGLTNPDAAIREICAQALAESEAGDGGE